MAEKYISLNGENLCVVVGSMSSLSSIGVVLYRSTDGMVPYKGMSEKELQASLPDGTRCAHIPLIFVRQIISNGKPVWRNEDCFDLLGLGIYPDEQSYFGNGSILVELRDDCAGIDRLVNIVLAKEIGLSKVE